MLNSIIGFIHCVYSFLEGLVWIAIQKKLDFLLQFFLGSCCGTSYKWSYL